MSAEAGRQRAATTTAPVLMARDAEGRYLKVVAGLDGTLRERVARELDAAVRRVDPTAPIGAEVATVRVDRVGETVMDVNVPPEYRRGGGDE